MKKIDVIKEILLMVVISLMFSIASGEDDAKVTPTPTPTATATSEPTPTACCPDESSFVPVYWDPKTETWKGEMTDVTLSSGGIDITNSGRCVSWEGPGMEVMIYAGGGDDTDYCVDTETGNVVRVIDPEVTFSWMGYGYVDENNDRIFHLTPTEPGVYNVSATAEDGGECNAGTELKLAYCQIIVYRVQGVFGPSEINRAEIATYEVIVEGLSPERISWYSYDHQLINTSTQWPGKIVKDTVVSCNVTLKCPFTQYEIPVGTDPVATLCNDREWNITVGSCEESTEPFPEDDVTHLAYLCDQSNVLGRHRDINTKTGYAFYPNDIEPGTEEPATTDERKKELVLRGVNIVQIMDNGPNNGFWYVQSSTFVVEQEFIMNKWIKPDGPNPPGSDINWYNKNLLNCNNYFGCNNQAQGVGVAAYYGALKDHENEGNHITSNGYGSGHHAQMRREEEYFLDLRLKVEDNYSKNLDNVKNQVCNDFINSENAVNGDPSHVWVEGNWCPTLSIIPDKAKSTYNPDTQQWDDNCDCIDITNP